MVISPGAAAQGRGAGSASRPGAGGSPAGRDERPGWVSNGSVRRQVEEMGGGCPREGAHTKGTAGKGSERGLGTLGWGAGGRAGAGGTGVLMWGTDRQWRGEAGHACLGPASYLHQGNKYVALFSQSHPPAVQRMSCAHAAGGRGRASPAPTITAAAGWGPAVRVSHPQAGHPRTPAARRPLPGPCTCPRPGGTGPSGGAACAAAGGSCCVCGEGRRASGSGFCVSACVAACTRVLFPAACRGRSHTRLRGRVTRVPPGSGMFAHARA